MTNDRYERGAAVVDLLGPTGRKLRRTILGLSVVIIFLQVTGLDLQSISIFGTLVPLEQSDVFWAKITIIVVSAYLAFALRLESKAHIANAQIESRQIQRKLLIEGKADELDDVTKARLLKGKYDNYKRHLNAYDQLGEEAITVYEGAKITRTLKWLFDIGLPYVLSAAIITILIVSLVSS